MLLRNAHTAGIDGVPPGGFGDFDHEAPGVRVLLDAGLLERVPQLAPTEPQSEPSGYEAVPRSRRRRAGGAEP